MTRGADLLVEIGTEELPPKALPELIAAFADGLSAELDGKRLTHSGVSAYGSPRRLALIVGDLVTAQENRKVERKGPPVRVAFDENGEPTPAARAFAKKCGVGIAELSRSTTDKGEWLTHKAIETGLPAAELLPAMVETALAGLPIPRPMRWGASDIEFVRPVHWVLLLHGSKPVSGRVLGIEANNTTRGHRFLAPDELVVGKAGDYLRLLEEEGYVLADFAERRARIEKGVAEAARECGGEAVSTDALLDEVTALVEWPVPITGRFDETFLGLPREVIVATLTSHQRYFPVARADGALLPAFVTVANLVSKDPQQVREGNERVIQPRLADAAFFWESDRRIPLAERQANLVHVVYQQGLGSVRQKSERVSRLASRIAGEMEVDPAPVERAAALAKCDLLTGMVGEFPELQGTMGRHYALADGEPAEVAEAIGEQYQPRFAGDAIPATLAGRCLSVADKLDSLCGIFSLGKKPSGHRDPFGSRRAALGIVRTIVEGGLDVDLKTLIEESVAMQPVSTAEDVAADVYDYIVDRLRGYFLERDGISAEMFEAVREREPHSLVDFDERLRAVAAFVGLDSAASLAAANKRIKNILRQAGHKGGGMLDAGLLSEEAEKNLHRCLEEAKTALGPLLRERAYTAALTRLADLREPVDAFFDDVMVMTDDDAVKRNRLTLLESLRKQFLDVADVSRLAIK